MVAGDGFAPPMKTYEDFLLLLHYPAILMAFYVCQNEYIFSALLSAVLYTKEWYKVCALNARPSAYKADALTRLS